jgi:PKD repeat protein
MKLKNLAITLILLIVCISIMGCSNTQTKTQVQPSTQKITTAPIETTAPVKVMVKPDFNFTISPSEGQEPLTVTFSIVQSNDPSTKWLWDFGDASTSTKQSGVTHTYSKPGVYYVSLTGVNEIGNTTMYGGKKVIVYGTPAPYYTTQPQSSVSSYQPSYSGSNSGSSTTSVSSASKKCWVNDYYRKDGTHVSGYWRSC